MSRMPAGADWAFDQMCEEWARQEREEQHFFELMQETRNEAVCCFYETGLSWSAAESMARLWAKEFDESEWHDDDVCNIATKLKLEDYHAFAILGKQKDFVEAKKLNVYTY